MWRQLLGVCLPRRRAGGWTAALSIAAVHETEGMSKQKEVADWEKNARLCKKALQKIMKIPGAGVFMEPVDWKGLGLTNYLDVIKKPMDLGTISTNIDAVFQLEVRLACVLDCIRLEVPERDCWGYNAVMRCARV